MTDLPEPAAWTALAAEIEKAIENATRGPWQVVETRHPWHLSQSPIVGIPVFEGQFYPEKSGEHVERKIFTAWDHPQIKGPDHVVTGANCVGMEPGKPVHIVEIREADANYIALVNPANMRLLLDQLLSERQRAETAEAELKQYRCPIGLDNNHTFCSAMYCYQCLGDRFKAAEALAETNRLWAEKEHAEGVRLSERLKEAEAVIEPFAKFDTEDFPDTMRLFDDDASLRIEHLRAAYQFMKAKGEAGELPKPEATE